MSRQSGLAHKLLAGAVLLAASLPATLAQTAAPTDAAATAVTADQPRRGRDRRRATEPVAAPAPASTAVAAAATAQETPAAEIIDTKIVCKDIKLTGTKISRRICGTPEQWAAQQKKTTDDAQETMRQVRDRSSIVVSQPDNPLGPASN